MWNSKINIRKRYLIDINWHQTLQIFFERLAIIVTNLIPNNQSRTYYDHKYSNHVCQPSSSENGGYGRTIRSSDIGKQIWSIRILKQNFIYSFNILMKNIFYSYLFFFYSKEINTNLWPVHYFDWYYEK